MRHYNNQEIPQSFFHGDTYTVSGKANKWVATVFQGVNIVEEISAVSEKQAHFLAKARFPEALSPAAEQVAWEKEYAKEKRRRSGK